MNLSNICAAVFAWKGLERERERTEESWRVFNNAQESGLGAVGNKSLLSICKYMVMKLPLSFGQRRTAATC